MILVSAAWALTIDVHATVQPDLAHIVGELVCDGPVTLVDALAALPVPATDRDRLRTYPQRVDRGELSWAELSPGHFVFQTRLPERYGDVGVLPMHGLWANGAWLPQPVDAEGRPLVVTWRAEVALPDRTIGVLNGQGGPGITRWQGEADRLALAVLRHAVMTPIAPGVTLLESERHRRHLGRELGRLAAGWSRSPLVIVEDRDFQRLARPAPGMVYLSDQAFRVVPGVHAFHRDPVWRAMNAAAWPSPDGWVRDFAGAAVGRAPKAGDVARSFGWLAWNPVVDAILHDGTTPFYADLFAEPFAEHPNALDALDDRIPGRAAAAQVDALLGTGAAWQIVQAGDPRGAGSIPEAIRQGWSVPYRHEQDYVAEAGRVVRHAPPDAPPEVVTVTDRDGARSWVANPGEAVITRGPGRVGGAVDQRAMSNDAWPRRWSLVAAASLDDVNPTQGTFSAWGELVLRRQGDNRNVLLGTLSHDEQDLASVGIGFIRYVGPLLDRQQRQHRLYFSTGVSLLDPAFRPTDTGVFAVDGTVSYDWNTKGSSDTAVRGHRLTLWGSGGFVPGSDDRWASAGAQVVGLLPLSLRNVVALRLKGAWASGDVEHRLITLGGSSDVRAVPSNGGIGNERVMATLEYRWAPVHHIDVPLLFGWLTEMRVVPAVDVGRSWRGDLEATAVGANIGMYWNIDNLGQLPSISGMAVAFPVWSEGVETEGPQYYIEFSHPF